MHTKLNRQLRLLLRMLRSEVTNVCDKKMHTLDFKKFKIYPPNPRISLVASQIPPLGAYPAILFLYLHQFYTTYIL
jgi:hypothetical protein